jgi:L-glutamine:2-deoxy-scyllo-inosose/3-amino-2,3-dideoxy-scyllo-inosose aminotransferase
MAKLALKGGKKAFTGKLPQWPVWDKKEEKALLEALHKTDWGGYPPPNTITRRFCAKFAKKHDSKFCFTNASGTAALMLACKALGIGFGDEVIVPALTFTATASCALFVDALPVFVDVKPDTLCIDPDKIEAALTPATRAIIPVHLGAHAAEMDRIMEIARRHNLFVIEDCAHAHGMKYKGLSAGGWGHINCFSFQSSKVMTAGEGGACTMNEESYYDKIMVLTNAGRKGPREGSRFDTLGWALRLTEFQAAILEVGLERLFKVQMPTKQKNYKLFQNRINQIPGLRTLPDDPNITRKSGYGFIVMYDEEKFGVKRDEVVKALNAEGVPAFGAFYEPVYNVGIFPLAEDGSPATMPQFRGKVDYRKYRGACPVSEKAAYHETIWVLHRMFLGTREQTEMMCDAFEKVIENIQELR